MAFFNGLCFSFPYNLELFTCITLVDDFVIIRLLFFNEAICQLLFLIIWQFRQDLDCSDKWNKFLTPSYCTFFHILVKWIPIQCPKCTVNCCFDLCCTRHIIHQCKFTETLSFVIDPKFHFTPVFNKLTAVQTALFHYVHLIAVISLFDDYLPFWEHSPP